MKEIDGGSRLEIRLLGAFDARVDGVPLGRLRTKKGQQLLALLALRRAGEVRREWLTAALWPDSEPEQAAYNLRRALSDLRSGLGTASDYVAAPTFQTLRLETPESVFVDLARFELLCRDQAEDSLREAVDLYRGPLLEGWNEEWVLAARQEAQQSCLDALGRLASLAEAREDWTGASGWLRRVIAVDPFDEPAYRRLMESLGRAGSHAAATLVYRELRTFLRKEINAEPAAETRALFESLQRDARTAAPQRPTKSTRDEVQQRSARASALPVQVTSFVGREAERRDVAELVSRSRLLTLTGTGGCGKTRLALQVASEVETSYPDGVRWVEFAAVTRGDLVWRVVADAMGLKEQSDRPLEEIVCGALAGKPSLLILDNCEHLLRDIATMTAVLLRRCPETRIFATSREPLDITGETTWRVPSLSTPQLEANRAIGRVQRAATAAEITQFESVRLFTDRAAMADPRFGITDSNAHDVALICKRLDGIPLAIELAASRVGTMTTGQIATRLEDRYRLLRWGKSDLLPRQKTIRALIDWSYDHLSGLERVLFRRLAVFAGGWTLEAAEDICAAEPEDDSPALDPDEIFELHARLVDKSLVVFESTSDGSARYRMLETIRHYALERLRESAEEAATRGQHAAWYTRFSASALDRLMGPDQARTLTHLDAENDNLRAAMEHTIHTVEGLELASSLWRFWYVRGHLSEGISWLKRGLELNPTANLPIKALAQLRVGVFAWALSRFDEAQQWMAISLAAFRELGDDERAGNALQSLGMVAQVTRDYPLACQHYEEAAATFRKLNKRPNLAASLLNLGAVLHEMRELELSRVLHEESLLIRRELSDTAGIASSLGGLGRVLAELGHIEAARDAFVEAVEKFSAVGHQWGLTQIMFGISYLGFVMGCPLDSLRLLGCMTRMREEMGAGHGLADDPGLEEELRKVRENLGAEVYDAAWEEGRNMDADAAIQSILGGDTSKA